MTDDLNDLSRIGIKGFLEERDRRMDERFTALDRRLEERFAALSKALELQATEYARRFHDLNGAFERDRVRQNDYVTVDKWEARNEAEQEARTTALLRINEKFDDYLKRYEERQHEVDLLLAAQKGAAEAAIKAAEQQGRKSNRNIAVASLVLGLAVFAANVLPYLVRGGVS